MQNREPGSFFRPQFAQVVTSKNAPAVSFDADREANIRADLGEGQLS